MQLGLLALNKQLLLETVGLLGGGLEVLRVAILRRSLGRKQYYRIECVYIVALHCVSRSFSAPAQLSLYICLIKHT